MSWRMKQNGYFVKKVADSWLMMYLYMSMFLIFQLSQHHHKMYQPKT